MSLALLGEGNAEETEDVSIGGLDVHVGLDQSLPLAHHGAEFVGCEIHAVEVGQAVAALDIFDAELDVTVCVGFVVLEIGQRDGDHSAFQAVRGNLGALGTGDEGLADFAGVEDGGGLD